MNKKDLEKFLYKARGKTSAKAGGEVEPLLPGTEQTEYAEGDWVYRDVYYDGKSFSGIEAVFFRGKPVWAGSYYGKGKLAWEELDEVLRRAQQMHPETMGYKKIEVDYENYHYECIPDSFSKSIDEIGGIERITKDGEEVYIFYYAGSLL